MVIIARFIILLVITIAAYACIYFLLFHWTSFSRTLIFLLSFIPVLAITHFSVRLIKEDFTDHLINTMFTTSFMFGIIGFFGGFIGSIYLVPGGQLGFLLGFWTGPLGFLLGVFLSLFRWIVIEKRNKNE